VSGELRKSVIKVTDREGGGAADSFCYLPPVKINEHRFFFEIDELDKISFSLDRLIFQRNPTIEVV